MINIGRENSFLLLPQLNLEFRPHVYVGDKHIYPEPFLYTIIYKSRVNFSYHGKMN